MAGVIDAASYILRGYGAMTTMRSQKMHSTLRHNHCHVMTFLFSTRTSKLGVAVQFAGNCMLSIGENSSFETATFRQKRMRWMTQSGASSMMYVRLREGKPGTGLVRVPTVNHRGSTLEMVCPILPRAMQSSAKIPYRPITD